MRQGRDARRRREDTWGIQAPSTSRQHPPASSVDENMQVQQQLRETPARRRREDTWDAAPPAVSYNGPLINAQGGSAQQFPVDRAGLSKSSGILSLDDIMSSGYTQTGPGASSLLQRLRLPRFREVSQQAPSFEHVLAPSISQQGSPVQHQPDNPSQFQRSSHGVNLGPLFQPHQAGPEPNTLEEVQIPDRGELDAMEHIHGRPRLMSQFDLHCFCIAYDVPLDIASDMRALSMIGVYPSSLIYLDHQSLAKIPAQWHWNFGTVIPPLYWARLLHLKQDQHREHVEHGLSQTPGPCRCNACQDDHEYGTVIGHGGLWRLGLQGGDGRARGS